MLIFLVGAAPATLQLVLVLRLVAVLALVVEERRAGLRLRSCHDQGLLVAQLTRKLTFHVKIDCLVKYLLT